MCTTVGFAYKKGVVFGRTLEVGIMLDNKIAYVPQNTKRFITTLTEDFSTVYATIGTSFFAIASFGDGINEKGLMGSNNLFPGYATFAERENPDKINLTTSNAFDYLLTRCVNVAEVKEEAEKLCIIKRGRTEKEISTEMHFYFMDAEGKSVVLEPQNGSLVAFDNPFGVLTNAPEFSWHTTNLRNYLPLQPENIDARTFNRVELTKFGEGSGSLGLPGDFTPPSRFVRSAYFVAHTPKDLERKEAILQAFRILSYADIPKGAVIDKINGHNDETLYTGVMDSQEKAYFIKNQNYIDLQAFYLDDFKEVKVITFIELKKEMTL